MRGAGQAEAGLGGRLLDGLEQLALVADEVVVPLGDPVLVPQPGPAVLRALPAAEH